MSQNNALDHSKTKVTPFIWVKYSVLIIGNFSETAVQVIKSYYETTICSEFNFVVYQGEIDHFSTYFMSATQSMILIFVLFSAFQID